MATPSIKELDGLPKGEIHLAIKESEQKNWGLMEAKLKEVKEAIDKRLGEQDEKLDSMQEDLSALVGTDNVPGLVQNQTDQIQNQTKLIENLMDKHQQWHSEDLVFRSSMTTKVTELTDQHAEVVRDITSIKWFVRGCSAVKKAMTSTLTVAKESDTVKRVGVGGVLWIAVVQFCHVIWPVLHQWIIAMRTH